jgi:hypothetical protein
MKLNYIAPPLTRLGGGVLLCLSLLACDPNSPTSDNSGLDVAENASVRRSSPVASDESLNNPPSEGSSRATVTTSRERALASAKTFLSAYWNENPNPYFTEEDPPEVNYDETTERFTVIFSTAHLDSQIYLVLDKRAKKGNIIFGNGLGLGDPPTRDTRWERCQLFDIKSFRILISKYFIDGRLK